VLNFIVDKILDYLNAQRYNDPVPNELTDVYDDLEYKKSQKYKKENYRFSILTSSFSLLVTLAFFFLDGFAFVDSFARTISENTIIIALVFFGIIMFASELLGIPFSYFHTFIIEDKYGFNKTSHKTFFLDKIKGWLMMVIIGGGLLAVFSVFMNLFYARLIVPLFNKQTPLESGELRSKIENYATKVKFGLEKIFVIDGSKRSTKANAYFSGFGHEKRVTLFDTLINDLDEEEIVAVLAHEVGHYKRHHIVFNLVATTAITGFTFWILSLMLGNPILSEALNVAEPSFHIGLIAFGVLYTPLSEITGLLMNFLSRKFEYQADNYAKMTYKSEPLVSALKKLSKNSLSNLTPHKMYVFVHYSHPTLLERIRNLSN
jgi:STE24 endopeptidase